MLTLVCLFCAVVVGNFAIKIRNSMKNSITSLVPFLNKRDDSSLDCGYATSDYRYPFIMFSRDGRRCDLSFSDVSALCGDESASTWQVVVADAVKKAWGTTRCYMPVIARNAIAAGKASYTLACKGAKLACKGIKLACKGVKLACRVCKRVKLEARDLILVAGW